MSEFDTFVETGKKKNFVEREVGEKDYAAKVDKKWCPKCHAVQSYDEVRKRKKRCSNGCGVSYRQPAKSPTSETSPRSFG